MADSNEDFSGVLISGHKGLMAVEAPFDPSSIWGIESQQIWPGRRGFPVRGEMCGHAFESHIVTRSKRFYLLVDEELRAAADVSVGDIVNVSVQPDRTLKIKEARS